MIFMGYFGVTLIIETTKFFSPKLQLQHSFKTIP